MMWGICIGLVLGALLMNLAVEEVEKEKNIQKNKNRQLKRENIKAKEANKELRDENDRLNDIFKRISNLLNSNKYNNKNAILGKIKELISDYQSEN